MGRQRGGGLAGGTAGSQTTPAGDCKDLGDMFVGHQPPSWLRPWCGVWCTGKTQRIWVERDVGGGIRMGNT